MYEDFDEILEIVSTAKVEIVIFDFSNVLTAVTYGILVLKNLIESLFLMGVKCSIISISSHFAAPFSDFMREIPNVSYYRNLFDAIDVEVVNRIEKTKTTELEYENFLKRHTIDIEKELTQVIQKKMESSNQLEKKLELQHSEQVELDVSRDLSNIISKKSSNKIVISDHSPTAIKEDLKNALFDKKEEKLDLRGHIKNELDLHLNEKSLLNVLESGLSEKISQHNEISDMLFNRLSSHLEQKELQENIEKHLDLISDEDSTRE